MSPKKRPGKTTSSGKRNKAPRKTRKRLGGARRPLQKRVAPASSIPSVATTHQELPRHEALDHREQPGLGIFIVGIGASAGGLEAMSQLLGGLPRDAGMAI